MEKTISSSELVRGKTLKEWSKELNLSLPRIYQLNKKNQLESRIDGTWTPGKRIFPKYFGKSIQEWAEHFNTKRSRVIYLIRNKKLKHAIETGDFEFRKLNKNWRLIKGKNLAQWAKELGITRERARQLANKNLLVERIDQLKK